MKLDDIQESYHQEPKTDSWTDRQTDKAKSISPISKEKGTTNYQNGGLKEFCSPKKFSVLVHAIRDDKS